MNKNKIYLIVFAALLLIYLFNKFVFNTAPEKNVDMHVLEMDTAAIASIKMHQPQKNQNIQLNKKNGKWSVSDGQKEYEADANSVKNVLTSLGNLSIENIVANNDTKWKDFQLTDSLAIEVQVFDKSGKIIKDLMIGKFKYKPNPQGGNPYGRRNNIQGSTYVRLSGSDYSYLVEGFLSMTFNQGIDSYRNKNLVKMKPEDIRKITFDYPADSGFVLQKADSAVWMIGQDTAAYNKVNNFLRSLANYRENRFEDGFIAKDNKLFTVTIENSSTPVEISVYPKDSLNFVVHSNYNDKAYFSGKKSTLERRLLKNSKDFSNK
jgi:hypothetical protein